MCYLTLALCLMPLTASAFDNCHPRTIYEVRLGKVAPYAHPECHDTPEFWRAAQDGIRAREIHNAVTRGMQDPASDARRVYEREVDRRDREAAERTTRRYFYPDD